MSVKPRPDGYQYVTPCVLIDCAAAAIEFRSAACGAGKLMGRGVNVQLARPFAAMGAGGGG
jgi:hypothetical protein